MATTNHDAAARSRRISLRLPMGSLALVALTLLVFLPLRAAHFVYFDDDVYILQNAHVLRGITSQGLAWALTSVGYAANWHPLTWLSHMLDIQLFGLDPGKHHLSSLGMHVASTVLLFVVLQKMTGAFWRSALVSVLFAIHPLHVESVAWISERKDVLSAFFWVVSMGLYLRYAAGPRWDRYAGVLLSFAAGLFAKPMLVTLPFIFLLADYWPLGRWPNAGSSAPDSRNTRLRLLLEKIPFFLLSSVAGVLTVVAQQRGGRILMTETAHLALRSANALVSYLQYLLKMVYPVGLTAYYPVPGLIPPWQVLGSFLALCGLTAVSVLRRRRWPYLWFGWWWYLITLFPVSGLVKIGTHAYADRYTYLPLVGIFVVVAWSARDLVRGRFIVNVIAAVVGVGLVSVLAITARNQVGYWKDGITLFTRVLEVSPNAPLIRYFLELNQGVELGQQGNLEAAKAHLMEAIRHDPTSAKAHANLGVILFRQGRVNEAIRSLQTAVRIDPGNRVIRRNLEEALRSQSKQRR